MAKINKIPTQDKKSGVFRSAFCLTPRTAYYQFGKRRKVSSLSSVH